MAESTVIETEPEASPGGAIATALSVGAILRHYQLVQTVIKEIMVEGTHFGASFPGDTKKNLLKPGADALCLAFQLAPEYEVSQTDLPNGHREVSVVCKLRTPQGRVIGQGVGSCSTMEVKYRYRNGARLCPECGKDTIIKGKEEYGGGWLCFAKKGGCGAKYAEGSKEIDGQVVGKIENPDPADQFNTVLKIGKKRAHVDATITATAVSNIFTQDAEDFEQRAEKAESKEAAKRPAPAPAAQQPSTDRHAKAPGTDRHTNHAAPAAAATTAAKPASGAAGQGVSSVAPAAGTSDPKSASTAIYHSTKRALGDNWAAALWKHTSASWQLRLDTLREVTAAVEEIRRVVGDVQADAMVDNAFGNVDLTPESVQSIRAYLVKASHGEVANVEHQQQAAGGGWGTVREDEPPFMRLGEFEL